MLKYVASLWIAFDVAICLRTGYMSSPFSPQEWWGWLVAGGALAVFALIAEHFDRKADRENADALQTQLTKQEGFIEGAFTRMDHRLENIARNNHSDDKSQQDLIKLKTEIEGELKIIKAGMGASYWDVPPIRNIGIQGPAGTMDAGMDLTSSHKERFKSQIGDMTLIDGRLFVQVQISNIGPPTSILRWQGGYRGKDGWGVAFTENFFIDGEAPADAHVHGVNLLRDRRLLQTGETLEAFSH